MTDLDDAYANMAHIPGGVHYPARWMEAAAGFRGAAVAAGIATLDLPYGSGERQRFDLFAPQGARRGLVVYLHGGYWMHFDRKDWSHLARGPLAAGWAVAMPSYDQCPDVRIGAITRQIAAAIAHLAQEFDGPIRLCGHSAGGHLAARMLCPGVLAPGIRARVAKVVPISPLADLAPLMRTSMNAALQLDGAEAVDESPVWCAAPEVPVHVWVGARERPVFLEQARGLAEAWHCPLTRAPERHHFDVVEGLEGPSPLLDALLG